MAEQHPTEHLTQPQLVDLAVGDVTEQQPLVRHLSTCLRCRAEYDEVARAVDEVLVATPRVQPPPGFDRAVLDAMGMDTRDMDTGDMDTGDTDGDTDAGDIDHRQAAGHRRTAGRRRPWLLATAAVVGVLAGVGGTIVATQDDQTAEPPVLAEGTALRTSDGERVGSIVRSYVDGQPVIVVGVTDGPVGVHYECRLQLSDGRERVVGEWVLESEQGATWVVPAPVTGVEALQLVTDSGTVWSSAPM